MQGRTCRRAKRTTSAGAARIVAPGVIRATLDYDVASLQADASCIEDKVDLAGENNAIIDRFRAMHQRMRARGFRRRSFVGTDCLKISPAIALLGTASPTLSGGISTIRITDPLDPGASLREPMVGSFVFPTMTGVSFVRQSSWNTKPGCPILSKTDGGAPSDITIASPL